MPFCYGSSLRVLLATLGRSRASSTRPVSLSRPSPHIPARRARAGRATARAIRLLPRGGEGAVHFYATGLYTHAFVTKQLKAAVAGANGYAGMTAVSLVARPPR